MKRCFSAVLFAMAIPIFSFASLGCQRDASSNQKILNLDGVTLLLDLIDTIIDRNPDYEVKINQLRELNKDDRQNLLRKLVQNNKEDVEINRRIDALLNSPAYQLYYSQFRNVDPSVHRRIFYHLPYWSVNSPAGISENLLEVCENRNSVRTWVKEIISRIDLDKCHDIALEWVPDGEYNVPTTYFIIDGNGDAFARQGNVCFDLFGTILSKRSKDSRYDNLAEVSVDKVERILAHEFQHVYASSYLYSPFQANMDWRQRWKNKITRRIVSEGIAMQCNPPEGFRKAIMEDTAVVAFWITRLNEKLTAISANEITAEDMEQWFAATYHETAMTLLKEYLKREYEGKALEKQIYRNRSSRPSFVYTLGWWMITRILESKGGKEKVIGLLSEPQNLYSLYNKTIDDSENELRVIF